eukprot:Skav202939  [mRNA]  locus=scaffold422:187438:190064:+ [translate_table: standard]
MAPVRMRGAETAPAEAPWWRLMDVMGRRGRGASGGLSLQVFSRGDREESGGFAGGAGGGRVDRAGAMEGLGKGCARVTRAIAEGDTIGREVEDNAKVILNAHLRCALASRRIVEKARGPFLCSLAW